MSQTLRVEETQSTLFQTLASVRIQRNQTYQEEHLVVIKKLVDEKKFSNLTKLVRVIGWVWHGTKKWLEFRNRNPEDGNRKVVSENETKKTVLTIKEQEDVLKGLFLAAQKGSTFPDTTLSRQGSRFFYLSHTQLYRI